MILAMALSLPQGVVAEEEGSGEATDEGTAESPPQESQGKKEKVKEAVAGIGIPGCEEISPTCVTDIVGKFLCGRRTSAGIGYDIVPTVRGRFIFWDINYALVSTRPIALEIWHITLVFSVAGQC